MVYMGSKTGEDPDDILKQNHQMLAAVHSGRSEFRIMSSFFWKVHPFFHISYMGFFLFFPFSTPLSLTVLNRPKLLMFIAIDMVSEVLQPS